MVIYLGHQKLRNGYGEKFYVAVVKWNGAVRYSLRRFRSAEKAHGYGVALEKRCDRIAEVVR